MTSCQKLDAASCRILGSVIILRLTFESKFFRRRLYWVNSSSSPSVLYRFDISSAGMVPSNNFHKGMISAEDDVWEVTDMNNCAHDGHGQDENRDGYLLTCHLDRSRIAVWGQSTRLSTQPCRYSQRCHRD